jgi:predicted amidophosphoribosyltransferase
MLHLPNLWLNGLELGMALSKCPECNGKVSGTAKACPHCGHALTKGRAAGREVLDTTGSLLHSFYLIFAFMIVVLLPILWLKQCITG